MFLFFSYMNQALLILIVLLVCSGAFLRFERPRDWNRMVDTLKAPGDKPVASSPDSATTQNGDDATPAPPPPPKPKAPEYITPTTAKFVPNDHVADVAQPAPHQESASIDPTVADRPFVPPSPLPAQENWTWITSDGRTFKYVVVQRVEADIVTISHNQGNSVINIADLPSDIQKQLNYDPAQATAAAAARKMVVQPVTSGQ